MPLDTSTAARFANLALDCVHREYPNKIAHVLSSDADVRPPRELTPAFYGCFDWHSAVHGHWMLARLARLFTDEPFAKEAVARLQRSITPENIEAEVRYLLGPNRDSFERPYGLAWLLALHAELTRSMPALAAILAPLEDAAFRKLSTWIAKLPYPDRSGQHANTAFALGLILDAKGRDAALFRERALHFYANDEPGPLRMEPSGEDFLSPCLAEADLMRRVLPPEQFAGWLRRFLPDCSTLPPAGSPDRTDGKLAHLDGLNLSRAWMLRGIANGLPEGDLRRVSLLASAEAHRTAGLESVTGEHYEGGHWLGTFAVYLETS
ncbi:MAG: DUF2891 domain-containing protein [Bryobacteraceae bacterium]